jgi:hypothetical protein
MNIRSDFVKKRAAEIAALTGQSMTQVVEDAVRAYRPPPQSGRERVPDGFEIKGRILVQKSPTRATSIDEILEAIEEGRNRPLFYDTENPTC